MDFVNVKEWLDRLVAECRAIKASEFFSSQIKIHTEIDNIYVDKGIDLIADMIGVELKEKTESTFTRKEFEYGGINFYSTIWKESV